MFANRRTALDNITFSGTSDIWWSGCGALYSGAPGMTATDRVWKKWPEVIKFIEQSDIPVVNCFFQILSREGKP